MNEVYSKVLKCYESIKDRVPFKPKIALVLGSGLGDYGNDIKVVSSLPYNEIADFPVSTVPGHKGQFIFGYVNDVPVVCMQGRVHYYEGYPVTDVVLPTRLMKMMGADILFLTNASGGINLDLTAGDFMLITDHISNFAPNPLIGQNIEELGTRFPDMTRIYDAELCNIITNKAAEQNSELFKGVYVQLSGPSYESPSDVKALRLLGGSAVGMSTAIEAIAARHMGMRVCGISCISNMAAGITGEELNHEEVQKAANSVAERFVALVRGSIAAF